MSRERVVGKHKGGRTCPLTPSVLNKAIRAEVRGVVLRVLRRPHLQTGCYRPFAAGRATAWRIGPSPSAR